MFNVNLNRLAALLLPICLRKRLIYAILRSAVAPLNLIQSMLVDIRSDCNTKIKHTPQVCYIKSILKREFGGDFEIDDFEVQGDWLITYDEDVLPNKIPVSINEVNEVFSPNDYIMIHDENNMDDSGYSFVVYYPTDCGIEYDNDNYKRMIAIVNYYRLAGKKAIYKPLN